MPEPEAAALARGPCTLCRFRLAGGEDLTWTSDGARQSRSARSSNSPEYLPVRELQSICLAVSENSLILTPFFSAPRRSGPAVGRPVRLRDPSEGRCGGLSGFFGPLGRLGVRRRVRFRRSPD